MDDTIAGDNVGDDDFRVIDEDFAILDFDADVLSSDGLSFTQCDNVFCHYLTCHHVVEQDVDQLLFIFGLEQAFYGASR